MSYDEETFDERYAEALVKFVELMLRFGENPIKVIEYLEKEDRDILIAVALGTYVGIVHGSAWTPFAQALLHNYHWIKVNLQNGEKPEKLIEMLKRAEREQRMRDFATYGAI